MFSVSDMPDFGEWKSVMRKVCFAGKRRSVFACVVSRGDGQREGAVCATTTSMQRSTGLQMADAGSRWQTLSPVGRYARHSSSGCMWLWLIPRLSWASLPALSGVHEHVPSRAMHVYSVRE